MDVEIINNKNSLNFLAPETISTLFFLSFSSRKCVTISLKKAAMQIFWNDYKKIDKNAPREIIEMAKKEQKFRHFSTYFGQISALIIGIG